MANKVYLMENLGCAHCAGKIETEVNQLPQVEEAVMVFATKQLRVKTTEPEGLEETIEKIAQSYEPDITVHDRDEGKSGGHHHTHHDHDHEHHHHDHGEVCGCGHDHDHEHHHHDHGEACCCGHDHDHEHEHHHHHDHGEACGCGHDHDHEHHHHEHGEACGCGHDHHHEDLEEEPLERSSTTGGETRVYTIENLDCANCGAKIERRINAMEGVSDAVLTFATKQLRVTAPNHDGLAEKMVQTARAIEPDVQIIPPEIAKKTPKKQDDSNKKALIELILGAVCMAAGIVLESVSAPVSIAAFIIGYIILGRNVVWTAVRNLTSGHVFDENFLMTVATLGAFVIGEYPEAVGVMLFFQVGELFEHIAVEKSRSQIMDAVDMRPETVQWEHDGKVETIPAEEAEVEDILVVRPGDRVPLDGVVLEGESFLDTSAVTGEPVPVRVAAGDELVSGCVNTSGLLRMRVTKPLSESMVTRILDAVENAAASKPRIDRFITRFARVYTPIVVAIAVLTAVVPSLVTGDWQKWVYTALTFLVISCPCALVLSVPLSFFAGIGTASRKGILFKGGASMEMLADIKAAALDKTGTITKGTFTVTAMEPAAPLTENQLLQMAAACEQASTHPIGVSIVAAAQERHLTFPTPHEVKEAAGHGIYAVLDDNTLLCGGKKLMDQYNIDIPELPAAGGATVVYLACNGQFAGRILISDTIKEDAKAAIAQMKRYGVASAMLTGDAQESANAIAAEAGVDSVYAHLLPEEKVARLQDVRAKYGPVMFVGDGINDAPVLAGADVGAAMGTGADAAIEAADVVFLTGELSAIPQAIALAKKTAAIAKQNIVFALVIKIAVMVLGLLGIASMWLAVFADTGVAMLCVLNSIRMLYQK
ncbi:MAG: heavy metal translocating P-type ATPase [Eubacteriales bacterium]|nr:heavy metal translocating P-type ATPase [Eubacteriales bacterium]